MSAFLLSKRHIDAMVTSLLDHGVILANEVDDVGLSLWIENHRSVSDRYAHRPDRGVGAQEALIRYEFARNTLALLGAQLKTVHCYEYQSCEHDGWIASRARALATGLRVLLEAKGANRESPAYRDAPWGIEDDAPPTSSRASSREGLPI